MACDTVRRYPFIEPQVAPVLLRIHHSMCRRLVHESSRILMAVPAVHCAVMRYGYRSCRTDAEGVAVRTEVIIESRNAQGGVMDKTGPMATAATGERCIRVIGDGTAKIRFLHCCGLWVLRPAGRFRNESLPRAAGAACPEKRGSGGSLYSSPLSLRPYRSHTQHPEKRF